MVIRNGLIRVFDCACYQGNLDIAQWLFNLDPPTIQIYLSRSYLDIFKQVCRTKKLNLAQWLLQLINPIQQQKVLTIYHEYFGQFYHSKLKSTGLFYYSLNKQSQLGEYVIRYISQFLK
jgi:hypothetical protein